MPTYSGDVYIDVDIDQDWIDEHASDGPSTDFIERLDQLINEVKYLHQHETRTKLEMLEDLRGELY